MSALNSGAKFNTPHMDRIAREGAFLRMGTVVIVTIDIPVCQTDYLATIADVVGVELPDQAGEDR